MSKPRIFVSSTYYDLKYVRERIENFINAYCFEPILFESDAVYFQPDKPLDTSCYNEVANCHMMILIIGGRYGSLATEENKEKRKENYEKQYVSITRKEYETAREKGIPVMIFVEQNVYTEYRTYQTNKSSLPDNFRFAYVDDIRIFDFISSLEQNAIKQFNKVDDIEHYFSHQISGMLLSYLTQLQIEKTSIGIKNAIDQLNKTNELMQNAINTIAEKVLAKDKDKYEVLLLQQKQALVDFYIGTFYQNIIGLPYNIKLSKEDVIKMREIIIATLFNIPALEKISTCQILEQWKALEQLSSQCVQNLVSWREEFANTKIFYATISNQTFKIVQLFKEENNLFEYFKKKLLDRFGVLYGVKFDNDILNE